MPQITLTYFGPWGRAEATRLALHYGGIKFEDKHIAFAEFRDLKHSLPYGQLPVLEVDGVVYAQSTAMLRYAGKLSGLYPEDPLKAMKVDEIVQSGAEFIGLLWPSMMEKDPEKKKEMIEVLKSGPLLDALTNLTKQLEATSESSWYVGDSLTIADLSAMGIVHIILFDNVDHVPPEYLEAFPLLKSHHDAVLAHPKIATYYAAKN